MLTRGQLAMYRNRCDKDLLFFTRFFFKEIHGRKFIVGDHHGKICHQLSRIEKYELELLNINIPPRFSKTELAAVNMIARGIGMNPASNWLYITASDELRASTSVSIRDIVSHPYFKVMYGIDLKKDQNSKNLWRTTQGGGLKTATIFGQITGFGAGQMVEHDKDLEGFIREFEGCIVLDDINKTDDSEVENANNEKVSRTLFNTIFSRKNSKDTPIINIQQRAGMTDATQQLMQHYKGSDKAEFMVMPVISNGLPLWPWKMDLEKIEEIRTSPKTAHVFDTQYMQKPIRKAGLCFPEGELNRFDHTKFDTKSEEIDAKVGFIDIADTGEDDLCMPLGLIIGQRIYIHDVVFTKEEIKLSNPQVSEMINENGPQWVRAESNMGGSMYCELLRPLINDDTTLLPIRAKGNKHTRIITMSAFIKKFVYFREVYDEDSHYGRFMANLTDYTKDGKSDHDDAPDGLTGLCVMIKRFYSSLYEGEAVDESQDGYSNNN